MHQKGPSTGISPNSIAGRSSSRNPSTVSPAERIASATTFPWPPAPGRSLVQAPHLPFLGNSSIVALVPLEMPLTPHHAGDCLQRIFKSPQAVIRET